MTAFLFQIELPDLSEEIAGMIPEHIEYINKLFTESKLLSYSVAQSRRMLWSVVGAKDEQEAMQHVLNMPMYPYFTDVECHPLLVYNTLPVPLPEISLN